MKFFTKAFFLIFIALAFISCKNKNEKEYKECGIIFNLPAEYEEKGIVIESYGTDVSVYPVFIVNFNYKEKTQSIMQEYSELDESKITPDLIQEFNERYLQHSKTLFTIYLVPTKEYEDISVSGQMPEGLEKIKENDGYVYLLDIEEESTDGMDEQEIAQYKACRQYALKAKDKIKYINVDIGEYTEDFHEDETHTLLPEKFPHFTSKDISGKEITESIFANADLTVVNVWGTFCSPCIQEMPELASWSKSMPSNMQIIGLICDVNDIDNPTLQDALDIVERTGADFLHIISNEDLNPILNTILAVPTTFFVDKTGKIIGEPIIGAMVEEYKSAASKYLEEIEKQ